MRAVASAVMAMLLVMALLAGNCLSCPQMLLAAAAHQPAHGCCHRGGTHTPGAECHTQSLHQFVKGDAGVHAAPAIPAVAMTVPVLAFAMGADNTPAPALVDHTPPKQLPIRI